MSMSKIFAGVALLQQRFAALPVNDRRALLVMTAAIVLTAVYFSLTLSYGYQQRAIAQYKVVREDARWIKLNLKQIEAAIGKVEKTPVAVPADGDASLLSIANASAKSFNLNFKRFQPEADTGLRLWLEAAEFDQILRWLATLEARGVVLDQLDIDRLEKQNGMVDARILLSRKP